MSCERIHDLAVTAFTEASAALAREVTRCGGSPSIEFVTAAALTFADWLMGHLEDAHPLDEPELRTLVEAVLGVSLSALVVSSRAQGEVYAALLLARNGPGAAGQAPV